MCRVRCSCPWLPCPTTLDVFASDAPTYVICKTGARSYRACEFLEDQGLEAINVEGGTMAWIISGRDDGGRGPTCVTYRWVDSQVEFEALIDRLVAEPRYALDTEFHRERTYFPKLALMQFAVDSETTLVDPLAVDLGALRRLFASDAVAVLHAAQQDLDVLTHACGAVPAHMYDTQLASGFLGLQHTVARRRC